MEKPKTQGECLKLEGKLDIHSVKARHDALLAGGTMPQHIDAKGVELLDTAGVQWLWWMASKHGGNLAIANASPAVKTVLRAAGLERWVTA